MDSMLDDINKMSEECNDILRSQENQLKELIAMASQIQPHEGSLYGILMTIINKIEKIDVRIESIENTLINLDNKLKCIDVVEIDI